MKTEKKCPKCGETKNADQFYIQNNGYWSSYCRVCTGLRNSRRKDTLTEEQRDRYRQHKKKKYDSLTQEERDNLHKNTYAKVVNDPERLAAYKEYNRNRVLKSVYNITPEYWDVMFERQGGLCGICKRDNNGKHGKRFAVDHDHNCCPGPTSCGNCVRGLLCNNCNGKMGWYELYSKEAEEWKSKR